MKKNKFFFVMGFVLLIGLIVGCSIDDSLAVNEFTEETTTRVNQINGDVTTIVKADGPSAPWHYFSEGQTAAISGDTISQLKINLNNNPYLDIGYRVYIPGIGYETGYNGDVVGYVYGGLRYLKIWTNSSLPWHHTTYRVKSRTSGWSDWKQDGVYAYASDRKDISAIEVVFVC